MLRSHDTSSRRRELPRWCLYWCPISLIYCLWLPLSSSLLPCLRLRFLCDGWYSVPNVLCLTCCNIGEGDDADDAADGMGNADWVVRAPSEASDWSGERARSDGRVAGCSVLSAVAVVVDDDARLAARKAPASAGGIRGMVLAARWKEGARSCGTERA